MTHLRHSVTVTCRRSNHPRSGKVCTLVYHAERCDLIDRCSAHWVGACGRELDEPRCPDGDDRAPF